MLALEQGSCPAGCWQPQAAAGAVRQDCPAGSLCASTAHPDRLFVAASGLLEETSQAGSPCCNPATLFPRSWPYGAGSAWGHPVSRSTESRCQGRR